jgi:prepilin signal peptidase PulO-like enzyme (type II secretory pathway)
MNPLVGILTPQLRKWLYTLYALAAVIVGALAVADVDVQKAPDVIAYLGAVLGFTAASNVPTPDTDEPGGGEEGAVSLLEACAVVVAVIAVLWAVDVIR